MNWKRKQFSKGAGAAWIFGLMMVLVVLAVFATGVVGHYDTQITIVSRAVEVYDTIHVAEFTKRTLDGAAFVNAKAAAQDFALSGGGIPVWTNETTMEELATKFELELESRMDRVNFNGLSGREITWDDSNITITSYDDTDFAFSGNKSFTVESKVSTPQVLIETRGAFENRIETSYFKLLQLGLDAAECPPEEGEKSIGNFEQTISSAEEDKYNVNILSEGSGLQLRYVLDCGA